MTAEDGFGRRDTGAIRFGWWKTNEHFSAPDSQPEAFSRSKDLVERDLRKHTVEYGGSVGWPVIAVDFGRGWQYAYRAQKKKLIDVREERPGQPSRYQGVRDRKTANRGELRDVPPLDELDIVPRDLDRSGPGELADLNSQEAGSGMDEIIAIDDDTVPSSTPVEPDVDKVLTVSPAGAGFGDPHKNRLVERAAVRVVTDHLESCGYNVTDVGSRNLGWDLTCVGDDGDIRRVEVKGVSGTKPTILLTANEYRSAHETQGWELAVVTTALDSPCLTFYAAADAVAAAAPMVYRVTLPGVGER